MRNQAKRPARTTWLLLGCSSLSRPLLFRRRSPDCASSAAKPGTTIMVAVRRPWVRWRSKSSVQPSVQPDRGAPGPPRPGRTFLCCCYCDSCPAAVCLRTGRAPQRRGARAGPSNRAWCRPGPSAGRWTGHATVHSYLPHLVFPAARTSRTPVGRSMCRVGQAGRRAPRRETAFTLEAVLSFTLPLGRRRS